MPGDTSSSADAAATVVNHVGQCTEDLERSVRFYVELLGFIRQRDLTLPDEVVGPFLGVEPPVGLSAVYLTCGSFVLELMTFDRPGNPPAAARVFNEPGLTHLSISVGDLEDVVGRVADLGGEIISSMPTAAMVRDPDGQVLELLPMSYRRRLEAQH